MNTLSVIYIGTGAFGVPILQALASDKRVRIPFVLTGIDRPAGRHLETKISAIKEAALENKLIVHQSRRIQELKQKIVHAKPDFLLVVAFGEIIPKEILSISNFGSVNIHASLLPKYRGASPIQEALRNGDAKTGITWTFMTEKMDAGPLISRSVLDIDPEDNYATLAKRLATLAASKTAATLINFAKTGKKKSQKDTRVTYCRKIKKEDGVIDVLRESASEIVNKIRAYTPWPGCFIFWNGKRLKIIQATAAEQKISPGEVKINETGFLAIGTRKGVLLPIRVQLESKREMDIINFLRGHGKTTAFLRKSHF